MKRLEEILAATARGANWVSAAAIVGIMILTVADIMLRFFRHPIPGTYELVGMMGGIAVSFSLAYTTVEKGHIAVDLVADRLPHRIRHCLNGVTAVLAAVFFSVVAVQCARYAYELQRSGEVSLSLKMPVHPFVFGSSAGFILLAAVLLVQAAASFRAAGSSR